MSFFIDQPKNCFNCQKQSISRFHWDRAATSNSQLSRCVGTTYGFNTCGSLQIEKDLDQVPSIIWSVSKRNCFPSTLRKGIQCPSRHCWNMAPTSPDHLIGANGKWGLATFSGSWVLQSYAKLPFQIPLCVLQKRFRGGEEGKNNAWHIYQL